MSFDIFVVGRSDGGESAGYYIVETIENVGKTVTLLGSWLAPAGEDDGARDAQVVGDDTNKALLVQTEGNGQTICWVATVRTV